MAGYQAELREYSVRLLYVNRANYTKDDAAYRLIAKSMCSKPTSPPARRMPFAKLNTN